MGLTEWIKILGLALKVALIFFEKTKDKPQEERREELSKLDDAVKKAKDEKDLSDLSKWIGGNL